MIKLDNDIYNITETVTDLQKSYMDEDESILAVGTNGFLADTLSLQIQNSIIVTSQLGNELFPGRAKFEKNVISHAIVQNITDINATPAKMVAILGIEEDSLTRNLINDSFTIDKDINFSVESFEFHLDYDIIITKVILVNNEVSYTAVYNMDRTNTLSDIKNPYITTPFIQVINSKRYLYIPCILRQVQHSEIYEKLISNSPIENKTFQFEFSDQLASFEVYVKDGDTEKYLTPVFEGFGIDNDLSDYCYYKYIDSTHIRVTFDSLSYMPGINAEITVLLRTTRGTEGNFEYKNYLYKSISSTKYGYSNISVLMTASQSSGGVDRKSVDELRRILPKEALSRGNITNTRDLTNYFNMLNTEQDIIQPQKKVDNQFERTYYTYALMKDDLDNVIPTNTINLVIPQSKFDIKDNRKLTLKPGCCILYNRSKDIGEIYEGTEEELEELMENDKTNFLYSIPYSMIVNLDPLYVSYYETVMRTISYTNFDYINIASPVQFICTEVNWERSYLGDDNNKYHLYMDFTPNVSQYTEIIKLNNDGTINTINLEVFLEVYNTGDNDNKDVPYRFCKGTLDVDYYRSKNIFRFDFWLETTDQINDDNKIRINGMKVSGSDVEEYGYLSQNINAKIYAFLKLPSDYDTPEARKYQDNIVDPGLEDYTLTNVYSIQNGLNMYTNYSEVTRSTITASTNIDPDDEIGTNTFTIKSVPVLRYTYINNEENIQSFLDSMNYKKAYVDNAMDLLENNFVVDLKLFNTYGPSKIYYIDKGMTRLIDRVNLTLYFELKLVQASNTYLKEYIQKDIKDIIEDLNDISSLHIPNLITTITNNYRNAIEYIEFLGFNNLAIGSSDYYGPGVQHLYRKDPELVVTVPEFLSINTLSDLSPDIEIRLV